jgi:iron complex transport system substrate-binding protein
MLEFVENLQNAVTRKRIYPLIKPFLLITFSLLLITACNQSAIWESGISQAKLSECRVVQHKLGEICIPVELQRIITLDTRFLTDPLLALGIKPIGIAVHDDRGDVDLTGLTSDDIKGIEKVGNVDQPSLEMILKLKPDLILAMDFAHEKIYEQLSGIAPTILVDWKKNNSFKVNLRYLAQILEREAQAERILSRYQARLEELREKLSRKPQEIEVTVLAYYGGEFAITSSYHTSHEVFSDIGLINKIAPGDGANMISLEVLSQYDADVLFIMNYDGKPKSFFLENPLIASLNAVKNNRVYFVDAEKWSANGPLGVNRMLDDLFEYLPEDA